MSQYTACEQDGTVMVRRNDIPETKYDESGWFSLAVPVGSDESDVREALTVSNTGVDAPPILFEDVDWSAVLD